MTDNAALILAGGTGSRMGTNGTPKQYLMVRDRPLIDYCLRTFQQNEAVNSIFIAADPLWQEFLNEWLDRSEIKKFRGYAMSGENRQCSIFNGLEAIQVKAPETERVVIHDAARPLVTNRLITQCLMELNDADGVMPALPIKDTCYRSCDGISISAFVPRSELFAGQAPEAFRFWPYLEAHKKVDMKFLRQISGSSELAYKCGLKVKIIAGEEKNIKITTREDMLLLEQYLDCGVGW